MGTSERSKTADAVPPADLLPVLRRSGILTDRQYEEVRAKVLKGEYPRAPTALAERLVVEEVLTEFQAKRLLRNKTRGFIIGRYVVLDRLGEGGMGRVFRAQHQLMGRIVALKLIASLGVSDKRSVARFQREMRLMGRLDHPNVVRAFDADQIGEVFYIAMEYVAGQGLDRMVKTRGPLPLDEVVDYVAQAALGLGHAHDRGIIHRDVKPSNLLVNEERQVKVLDLGLGALMEAERQASFATADGYAVGTIDYMSPEQASGRELDGRSDLFSLGCTMYHLLTGRFPFPGETALERLGRRIKEPPIPISDILHGLPPRLLLVLDKLLARLPEDRFQTAAEAAEALRDIAGSTIVTPPSSRSPSSEEPRPSVFGTGAPSTPAPEVVPPRLPPDIPRRARLVPWAGSLSCLAARPARNARLALMIAFGTGLALGSLAAISIARYLW
jgi:eukaryotic-like serine/threonine-protein kinase